MPWRWCPHLRQAALEVPLSAIALTVPLKVGFLLVVEGASTLGTVMSEGPSCLIDPCRQYGDRCCYQFAGRESGRTCQGNPECNCGQGFDLFTFVQVEQSVSWQFCLGKNSPLGAQLTGDHHIETCKATDLILTQAIVLDAGSVTELDEAILLSHCPTQNASVVRQAKHL